MLETKFCTDYNGLRGKNMINELLKAFTLIFVAEMGDKTQILAMAFATKYKMRQVLLGIFIGAALNHGIAVLLGSQMSNLVPVSTLQLIAGIAFILFAFWTLRPEEDDDEEETVTGNHMPVMTVALAFFIGELGDKTQLSAIVLATDAAHPAFILMGTVLGMIATGFLGIIVGRKLGDRVPELYIKIASSAVFLLFGALKLNEHVHGSYKLLMFVMIIATYAFMLMLLRKSLLSGKETQFHKRARELSEYFKAMEEKTEDMCLRCDLNDECLKDGCPVGRTKLILKEQDPENQVIQEGIDKAFNKNKATDSLIDTVRVMIETEDDERLLEIRDNLELMVFGEKQNEKDLESYLKRLENMRKGY